MAFLETLLLACALAMSLALRPWRMLRGAGSAPPLSTPLLASLVLLPWLWAWPAGTGLPVPLQWSGAALAVLMLGWPLAIPLLCIAGMGLLAGGMPFEDAISTTVWSGVLPATTVLLLGQAVRRAFGSHPLAYIFGRAYAVPFTALFICGLAAAWAGGRPAAADQSTIVVAAFLMAMGEATWTCAVASLLVAWRPQWLATWSDERYLASRKSPPRRA